MGYHKGSGILSSPRVATDANKKEKPSEMGGLLGGGDGVLVGGCKLV
jgi:hypothetical protein